MAKGLIEPRLLKGFRDHLPQGAIVRREMIQKLEQVFTLFGFAPIDTPALEYSEILLGKGGEESDKQLYRFEDNGGRDVALRFDLTVPFARFAAMHLNEIGTPFKRYHIAPVWRAEKPQRGRYREFFQCDFDIIGTKSMLADAETVAVIHSAMQALEINHLVRINNRLVLNGFFESLGLQDKSADVLRTIDKLDKLGKEVVSKELLEVAGLNTEQISQVFSFLEISKSSGNVKILESLSELLKGSALGSSGVEQLQQIFDALSGYGIDESACRIDLSIARGLDYYTGPVFETTLTDLPEIGSICSGGRFDNLASLYTKRELPGTGASIGLDRILGAFEVLNRLSSKATPARVLVTMLDEDVVGACSKIAHDLRAHNLPVEVYPGIAKLGAQLKYADRKGIELAIIAGSREIESNSCAIKNLSSGEQVDNVSLSEVVSRVKRLLDND